MRSAVTAELGARRPAEAVRLARRLVQPAPLTERHQELLVGSLAAAGDRVGARAAADACTRRFESELGVRPSPRVAQAVWAPAIGLTVLPDGRRLKARLEIEAGKVPAAATAHRLPRAAASVAEPEALAVRARMPRYVARAHHHRHLLTGKESGATVPV